MRPGRALALLTLRELRTRTVAFGLLFAALCVATTAGYRATYPTLAERLDLIRSFGANKAVRLFFGTPYRLETIGGFAAWRAGGMLALFAAFFGLHAAVRALRGEEEVGRGELVAAGGLTRPAAFAARTVGVAGAVAGLWIATAAALVAGGLSPSGSAYLALAAAAVPAAVYAGVGAVASQLMPTRRSALEVGGALLAVDFLVRVVADTADHPVLHWAAPLGWIEELRPFAGPRPIVLLLPVAAATLLVALALALERRRDLGTAIIGLRDVAPRPRTALLRSPTLLALRLERVGFAAWIVATAGFAFALGMISKSVGQGLSPTLRERLSQVGQIDVATPAGYLGLTFLFFTLAAALFSCGRLAAARSEEAEGRLEALFALPRDRRSWLAGQLALATVGAALIGQAAGLGAALGAAAVGAHVSLAGLLEAGLNCLPATLLFLGVGALLVALAPRHGVGAAYALVSVAFVWELVGSLVGAPRWLLSASPFYQIGLVPAASFRAGPAAAMLAVGTAAALAALAQFRRRDLAGA